MPMRLRLRGNRELVEIVSVVHVDLSGRKTLLEVPEDVRRFKEHVWELKVQSEALVALPEWLGELGKLQKLDLSHCNSLSALPESMGRLTGLQELRVSACYRLTALPESMGRLRGLQELVS